MSTLFLLLIFSYICFFLYKSFGENISILNYLFNIRDAISYVYNNITKFICTQALHFILLYNKFKKIIRKAEESFSIIRSRNYILIALIIHSIILYFIGNYVIFTRTTINQNWIYTEISNQKIEEKAIEDSAPDQPDDSSEPQFVENSQENDSNSSVSNGIDVFNEKVEIPTEAINFAPAPVITSKFAKTKIDFKPEQSQEKIKWGKEALYKEGKIAGINGYGSNGQGSGLGGRGAGNGSGGTGLKEGRIFGTDVKAKKLGVVFDVSFSMRPYTEMVEKEIKKSFPNATIYYVDGCSIDTTTKSIQSFVFLSIQHVDSIYWFCDLQDPQTKDGLYILENLLKNNNIRLYIKSMDKHPNPMLKSIISSTGGNYSFGLN